MPFLDIAMMAGAVILIPLYMIFLGWHYEAREDKETLFGIKDPDLGDYFLVGVIGAIIMLSWPLAILAGVSIAIAKISNLITRRVKR